MKSTIYGPVKSYKHEKKRCSSNTMKPIQVKLKHSLEPQRKSNKCTQNERAILVKGVGAATQWYKEQSEELERIKCGIQTDN